MKPTPATRVTLWRHPIYPVGSVATFQVGPLRVGPSPVALPEDFRVDLKGSEPLARILLKADSSSHSGLCLAIRRWFPRRVLHPVDRTRGRATTLG